MDTVNVIYATPHLHTVGKVLLDASDIVRMSALGDSALVALATAICQGSYTTTSAEIAAIVSRAERSSGAHLARKSRRKEARACQRQD